MRSDEYALRDLVKPHAHMKKMIVVRGLTAVNSDGFEIAQLGESFIVLTKEAGAEVGCLVSVRGVWLGDRTIKTERWHATKHRSWRVWVSIPPMLLAFWLLRRGFRWNWRRGELGERWQLAVGGRVGC